MSVLEIFWRLCRLCSWFPSSYNLKCLKLNQLFVSLSGLQSTFVKKTSLKLVNMRSFVLVNGLKMTQKNESPALFWNHSHPTIKHRNSVEMFSASEGWKAFMFVFVMPETTALNLEITTETLGWRRPSVSVAGTQLWNNIMHDIRPSRPNSFKRPISCYSKAF